MDNKIKSDAVAIAEKNCDRIKKILMGVIGENGLSEANLSGANLSWADLSEAKLSGANLTDVIK